MPFWCVCITTLITKVFLKRLTEKWSINIKVSVLAYVLCHCVWVFFIHRNHFSMLYVVLNFSGIWKTRQNRTLPVGLPVFLHPPDRNTTQWLLRPWVVCVRSTGEEYLWFLPLEPCLEFAKRGRL